MQKTVHDHKSVTYNMCTSSGLLRQQTPQLELRRVPGTVDYTTGIHTRVPVLLHYYC